MKRALIALSILTSTVALAEVNPFYAQAGFVTAAGHNDLIFTLGYQINENFGLELSGFVSENKSDGTDWWNPTQKEYDNQKLSFLTVAPTYRFALTESLYLGAKAGAMFSKQSRYSYYYSLDGKGQEIDGSRIVGEDSSSSNWGATAGIFMSYELDVMTLRLAHDISDFKGREGIKGVTSFNVGFKF